MTNSKFTRRTALRALALAGRSGAAVAVLAGCGETQIVEVIKEVPVERVVTQVVEKAVIQENIVTVTVKETAPRRDNITLVMQSWWSPSIGLPFQAWAEHIRTFQKRKSPGQS